MHPFFFQQKKSLKEEWEEGGPKAHNSMVVKLKAPPLVCDPPNL